MPGDVSPRDYFKLVRGNRNFRLLWSAQVVSEMGDWLYAVVIYSLILARTGSAKAVAIALVLQVLPQVLVSPMAGAINDRISRRSVMIATDIVRFVLILAMLLATHGQTIWPIYALLFLETAMWGFFEPGRSAIMPNVVSGDREIMLANTICSATWSFNLAAGAALGGVLAVAFGQDTVFLINAASFLLSAFLLTRIRIHEPHASAQPLRAVDLVDFRPVMEGFRYIRGSPRLLATLLAKFGLGLMATSFVIFPLYGDRIFPMHVSGRTPQEAGTLGLSLLMGARGVGSLLGPFFGSLWAGGRPGRQRAAIFIGFLILSGGYISLSAAPNIVLAVAAVVFAHSGAANVWVFSTTMIQTQAEDRFLGRVFSADYAFLVVAMSITSYLAGVAFDSGVPVRTLAFATGLLALLPAALWLFVAMPLWRDDTHT